MTEIITTTVIGGGVLKNILVVVLRTIVIQFYGALDGPDSDLSICVWRLLRKLLTWSLGGPKLGVVNFLKELWRTHRYKRTSIQTMHRLRLVNFLEASITKIIDLA